MKALLKTTSIGQMCAPPEKRFPASKQVVAGTEAFFDSTGTCVPRYGFAGMDQLLVREPSSPGDGKMKKRWEISLKYDWTETWHIATGDRLYIREANNLVGLDMATGREAWRYNGLADTFEGPAQQRFLAVGKHIGVHKEKKGGGLVTLWIDGRSGKAVSLPWPEIPCCGVGNMMASENRVDAIAPERLSTRTVWKAPNGHEIVYLPTPSVAVVSENRLGLPRAPARPAFYGLDLQKDAVLWRIKGVPHGILSPRWGDAEVFAVVDGIRDTSTLTFYHPVTGRQLGGIPKGIWFTRMARRGSCLLGVSRYTTLEDCSSVLFAADLGRVPLGYRKTDLLNLLAPHHKAVGFKVLLADVLGLIGDVAFLYVEGAFCEYQRAFAVFDLKRRNLHYAVKVRGRNAGLVGATGDSFICGEARKLRCVGF